MRTLHAGKNTLCLASDPPEGLQEFGPLALEEEIERTSDLFLRRPLFRRLLDFYNRSTQSGGYMLLKAHGVNDSKRWLFKDGARTYNMQRWIDGVDGIASAIFLFSCNPNHRAISSRYSLVFHMHHSFSILELMHRKKPVRLYVPGEGYVDRDRRRLHHTLANLEACIETPLRKLA